MLRFRDPSQRILCGVKWPSLSVMRWDQNIVHDMQSIPHETEWFVRFIFKISPVNSIFDVAFFVSSFAFVCRAHAIKHRHTRHEKRTPNGKWEWRFERLSRMNERQRAYIWINFVLSTRECEWMSVLVTIILVHYFRLDHWRWWQNEKLGPDVVRSWRRKKNIAKEALYLINETCEQTRAKYQTNKCLNTVLVVNLQHTWILRDMCVLPLWYRDQTVFYLLKIRAFLEGNRNVWVSMPHLSLVAPSNWRKAENLLYLYILGKRVTSHSSGSKWRTAYFPYLRARSTLDARHSIWHR